MWYLISPGSIHACEICSCKKSFIISEDLFLYCRDLYKYEVVRQRAIDTFRRNRPNMHMITAKMVAEDLHLQEWYLVTIERYFLPPSLSHSTNLNLCRTSATVRCFYTSVGQKGFKDSVQSALVYTVHAALFIWARILHQSINKLLLLALF